MLYEIHPPKDKDKVEWILSLQERLLNAICLHDVPPAKINKDWLKKLFFDIEPEWVSEKLATAKDKITGNKKILIQNVKVIAALPKAVRRNLYDDFKHDLQFEQAYDPKSSVFYICGLRALDKESEKVRMALRGLLECFYAPVFYKECGYRIKDSSGKINDYCKDNYLDSYDTTNPRIHVCPYCDGYDEDPQLDHYIKKSDYPGLTCHPLNLIPVCGNCNKGKNKGRKLVFSKGAVDPWSEWLHPYLRPAYGVYRIKIRRTKKVLRPALIATTALIQRQLDNHIRLINLDTRWFKQIKRMFTLTESKIDKYRREELGRNPTELELLKKLQEWADVAVSEQGMQAYSLIEQVFLSEAVKKNPDIFPELWKYSQNDITP